MRKYLKYELKKSLLLLLVLSAICAIFYLFDAATSRFWYSYVDAFNVTQYVVETPPLTALGTLLVLCFIIPACVYSFKMDKRSTDMYYSLPFKKEKLYFVKTMVGLFLVLVPFTVAYWSGFLVLLFRADNPYHMWYYVPAYFGLIMYAICLYGINAFVFTRANHVVDGIVFMFAYMLLGSLVVSVVESTSGTYFNWWTENCFTTNGPIILFMENMACYIQGGDDMTHWPLVMFLVPLLMGSVAYFLLFFNLRYERAENAQQTSDSWFGYKVLIPIYTTLMLASFFNDILTIVLISIMAFCGTIAYQRKITFSWKCWLSIAISVAVGVIWSAIIW